MGLFAPAKLPPAIAARLTTEVKTILTAPDMVERFTALGMVAHTSTPQELAARVKRDYETWKSVIVTNGIKSE
jgi:tripartite-type tricarboxylate transporter receptor subunit TctC